MSLIHMYIYIFFIIFCRRETKPFEPHKIDKELRF